MAKGKYIMHHCAHCDRDARMEMIGSTEQQPDRSWYRCTRCRHVSLLNVTELRRELEDAKKKLKKSLEKIKKREIEINYPIADKRNYQHK